MNSVALLKRLGFKPTNFHKVNSNSKSFGRSLVNHILTETHYNSKMELDEYETFYKNTGDRIYEYVTEKIYRGKGDSFWLYDDDNIKIWVAVCNYNIENLYIEYMDIKEVVSFETQIKSKMDIYELLPRKTIRRIKLNQLKI